MSMISVLVVDDSAFARKVFREQLEEAADVRVIGLARDGLEAMEEIERLAPDVVTLDLMMPNLDGVGLLEQLTVEQRRRTVIVSVSGRDSEPAVKALQLGAFDVVTKPTAMATAQLESVGGELLDAVRRCAEAARLRARPPGGSPLEEAPPFLAQEIGLIVVGASTGGPAAITRLVPALPQGFPVPVVVALHIPFGYTAAFAERLNQVSALHVREVGDGELILPGTVAIAPGGSHLTLRRHQQRFAAVVRGPPEDAPFAPSIDLLFESAAEVARESLLAVVLTGMGEDGLLGAGRVSELGGVVLAESWSSAVVYGMPRAVVEAGLASGVAPIEHMAAKLIELTRRPSDSFSALSP